MLTLQGKSGVAIVIADDPPNYFTGRQRRPVAVGRGQALDRRRAGQLRAFLLRIKNARGLYQGMDISQLLL